MAVDVKNRQYELYDLESDPTESKDLFKALPSVARRMQSLFEAWNASVEDSDLGRDYREGELTDPNPRRVFWTDMPEYEPYFKDWKKRPEFKTRLKDW